MTREEAHTLIDMLFSTEEAPEEYSDEPAETVDEAPARELPAGKRLVGTKSSGDRKYQLDEEKKTRQWVTNPEVLAALGWVMEDAVEIEDSELLRYQMGPAIYKVDEPVA